MNNGEKLLVGKEEAARLLAIGVSTLERYHAANWIPKGLRIGNCLRWRRAELVEWIEQGAPRPACSRR